MRRTVVGSLFLLACLAFAMPVRAMQEVKVPVLLYHHLEPDAKGENGAIIAVKEFAQQMAWLKVQGFTAISTAELADWLEGKAELPDKPVLITFDDGYRSNYSYAFPILARNNMKATIFKVSGSAGATPGAAPHFSWTEALRMHNSGLIEIQAHSHDGHRHLERKPALIAWSVPEIRRDTAELQAAFEGARLPRATAYAYPFGAYDEQVLQAMQADGIRVAFTVEPGFVKQGDKPLELKRKIIYPNTSLCEFRVIVTGVPSAQPCHTRRTSP